jgi:hypothetical protein
MIRTDTDRVQPPLRRGPQLRVYCDPQPRPAEPHPTLARSDRPAAPPLRGRIARRQADAPSPGPVVAFARLDRAVREDDTGLETACHRELLRYGYTVAVSHTLRRGGHGHDHHS